VRGKTYNRMQIVGRGRIDIESIVFDLDLSCLIAESTKFAIEKISDSSFIAGDGFNVNELARKRDCVHERRINHKPSLRRSPKAVRCTYEQSWVFIL
jgi:hypothetical protein